MSIFQTKSNCPYCNKRLEEKPKRKQKCPICGGVILVRSGSLVTEEEAFITDWLDKLEYYGVTRDSFNLTRDRLTKRFGQRANAHDTIWGILNELLMKHGVDNCVLKRIYQFMSDLVASEDRDPTIYLLQAAKARELCNIKFLKRKLSFEEFDCELQQIFHGEASTPVSSESQDTAPPTKLEKDNLEVDLDNLKICLGNEELSYVRRLRNKGKLKKAEELLLKADPSPAVLDELRKLASKRAREAKKNNNWSAVSQHLDGYTTYANRWREYCINIVNQEPPKHTDSDKKLLEEAKMKLRDK